MTAENLDNLGLTRSARPNDAPTIFCYAKRDCRVPR